MADRISSFCAIILFNEEFVCFSYAGIEIARVPEPLIRILRDGRSSKIARTFY